MQAALEYVNYRSEMEVASLRDMEALKQLKRLKKQFTEEEDIPSKDYHARRLKNRDQNHIFQAYMMLVDARIAQLRSKMLMEKGLNLDAVDQTEIAETMLQTLLDGRYRVSRYLVDQASFERLKIG